MLKTIAFAFGLTFLAQIAVADERAKLVGIWKLISTESELQDGSPRRAIMGQHPIGYIILTAQGRMMAVLESEGRKPAQTDQERAALLQTLVAYSGTYRLEGDKWITKVDVAWNPAWHGTEQVRYYKIDGDRLEVTTDWVPNTFSPGAPTTRGILMWERVK